MTRNLAPACLVLLCCLQPRQAEPPSPSLRPPWAWTPALTQLQQWPFLQSTVVTFPHTWCLVLLPQCPSQVQFYVLVSIHPSERQGPWEQNGRTGDLGSILAKLEAQCLAKIPHFLTGWWRMKWMCSEVGICRICPVEKRHHYSTPLWDQILTWWLGGPDLQSRDARGHPGGCGENPQVTSGQVQNKRNVPACSHGSCNPETWPSYKSMRVSYVGGGQKYPQPQMPLLPRHLHSPHPRGQRAQKHAWLCGSALHLPKGRQHLQKLSQHNKQKNSPCSSFWSSLFAVWEYLTVWGHIQLLCPTRLMPTKKLPKVEGIWRCPIKKKILCWISGWLIPPTQCMPLWLS